MATVEQIIARYPVLFHMAEPGSWPSIQQHGLLSTTALLDRFDYDGDEREVIESRWRPESVLVEHDVHGTAVVRDQGPMPPRALRRVLDGMTPCEWYRLIQREGVLMGHKGAAINIFECRSLSQYTAYRAPGGYASIVRTARRPSFVGSLQHRIRVPLGNP